MAPGEGEAAAEDADQREPGDEGNIDPDEDGGEEGGSLLSLLGSWHRIGKDRR